ncbi:hypothetical protein [Enterococcus sp. DIV0240a]|uniref:hypothetical protein n=1 Tax=unclassified Enterococcus TaxID=2608891 RepID=UPI003D2E1BF5
MDKFFTLEVDSQYSATRTSLGGVIDYERDIYFILPNGTMIIANPKVTKFVERFVRGVNEHPVNKFASKYKVMEYTKPWDSDPECIEYAEEIKRKRSEEKVDREETVIPLTGELGKQSTQLIKERLNELERESGPNLLEIKLKDTDSVPEVYYKGERVDGPTADGVGLVDASYHYHTSEGRDDVPDGANDIHIEYYDGMNGKYLDRKIVGHKRDV